MTFLYFLLTFRVHGSWWKRTSSFSIYPQWSRQRNPTLRQSHNSRMHKSISASPITNFNNQPGAPFPKSPLLPIFPTIFSIRLYSSINKFTWAIHGIHPGTMSRCVSSCLGNRGTCSSSDSQLARIVPGRLLLKDVETKTVQTDLTILAGLLP